MISTFQYMKTFAAQYSCGAYGAGNFDEGTVCQTQPANTPAGSTSDGGAALANTGMNVFVPLITGVLLVTIAIAVLVKTIKKHRKTTN